MLENFKTKSNSSENTDRHSKIGLGVRVKFPEGFLWGAATAAHQVEGNNSNSDWWAWEHNEKRAKGLRAKGLDPKDFYSGLACDSYNRFDEDFALAKSLHHNAHRLSIEWARIEPREGVFDEKQLDHYEKVLQSAKFHGLHTFVTLHHFTSPQWFMAKGGFAKKANVKYFVRYCKIAAKRLDQYADFWMTINEPQGYAELSYLRGIWPPQKKNFFSAWRVLNNLILAHIETASAIKLFSKKPIGVANDLPDFEANGSLFSSIPTFFTKNLSRYFSERTAQHSDFIGLNYYFHHHIGWFGKRKHSLSRHIITDVGWGVHPEGIEQVLLELAKHKKPIYITENGIADAKDEHREKFIKDHLYFVHSARQKGADVRGYLHWSLLDNYEWEKGFGPRFGLVEIDREHNLERKIRPSALAYAEICKNNYMEY